MISNFFEKVNSFDRGCIWLKISLFLLIPVSFILSVISFVNTFITKKTDYFADGSVYYISLVLTVISLLTALSVIVLFLKADKKSFIAIMGYNIFNIVVQVFNFIISNIYKSEIVDIAVSTAKETTGADVDLSLLETTTTATFVITLIVSVAFYVINLIYFGKRKGIFIESDNTIVDDDEDDDE